MTTFTYGKAAPTEPCVAYIALLDDDPECPILVIKNSDESHTYIYDDGYIFTRTMSCEDEAIHKFYPGDSVTITF